MTKSYEELVAEKKQLQEELKRQKLEAEVKALKKKTKKPSFLAKIGRATTKAQEAWEKL